MCVYVSICVYVELLNVCVCVDVCVSIYFEVSFDMIEVASTPRVCLLCTYVGRYLLCIIDLGT